LDKTSFPSTEPSSFLYLSSSLCFSFVDKGIRLLSYLVSFLLFVSPRSPFHTSLLPFRPASSSGIASPSTKSPYLAPCLPFSSPFLSACPSFTKACFFDSFLLSLTIRFALLFFQPFFCKSLPFLRIPPSPAFRFSVPARFLLN